MTTQEQIFTLLRLMYAGLGVGALILAWTMQPPRSPKPLPTLTWEVAADTGVVATLSAKGGRPHYILRGVEVDRETFYRWLDDYVARGMKVAPSGEEK